MLKSDKYVGVSQLLAGLPPRSTLMIATLLSYQKAPLWQRIRLLTTAAYDELPLHPATKEIKSILFENWKSSYKIEICMYLYNACMPVCTHARTHVNI